MSIQKSEGLEEAALDLLRKHKVKDFFFLDLSLPFLIKYCRNGFSDVAVRFSAFEPIEFVMKFRGLVKWVWIDCIAEFPLNRENYPLIRDHFQTCLVSPELYGRDLHQIEELKNKVKEMEIDAVCTKRPDLW